MALEVSVSSRDVRSRGLLSDSRFRGIMRTWCVWHYLGIEPDERTRDVIGVLYEYGWRPTETLSEI